MAGRIADDVIAVVRERSPIESVVAEHLQLRSAGGGELKGLCPFHEEKSPSFHVSPTKGYYHCFGCGEGGDVFDFVRKVEHLGFGEAVEKLAARAGVEVRYEGAGASVRGQSGQRARLVEANKAAVSFYAERLTQDPAAVPARQFLAARGFDEAHAEAYSLGYSPDTWDALTKHLTGLGFTHDELVAAGLTSPGQRGPVDRFRGRLMFPIRDRAGDPIGFGARALAEGQQPKYLNTPETPLYKKSHVLYGLDKARVEIGKRAQAVVVEGYTDVMACHLAGVPTAVATCGTALTSDHVAMLRRYLMDQDEFRGEVIFTFDGDSAGQRAALKAFEQDEKFVTQTFVAVEPGGLDPCDLRLQKGDAAVRDLVARRVPLFEFKVRSVLDRYDLETPEGRTGALREAGPVVASIRDQSLRPAYSRLLARWLGMEVEDVLPRIAQAVDSRGAATPAAARRSPDDAATRVEREALKAMLQAPELVAAEWPHLTSELFTDPGYADVCAAVEAAGDPLSPDLIGRAREAAKDDAVRSLVTALAVEPLRATDEARARSIDAVVARLQELAVTRRIEELKSRLQRLNPVDEPEKYNRLFSELIGQEAHKRRLHERAADEPTP